MKQFNTEQSYSNASLPRDMIVLNRFNDDMMNRFNFSFY